MKQLIDSAGEGKLQERNVLSWRPRATPYFGLTNAFATAQQPCTEGGALVISDGLQDVSCNTNIEDKTRLRMFKLLCGYVFCILKEKILDENLLESSPFFTKKFTVA